MLRGFFMSCLLAAALAAPAQTSWMLADSTLTYHVSHPMHEVEGVSNAARGRGACANGTCDFLIAAPVNTFKSGDSNRDLHMIQTVRGAENPMVVVRATFPDTELVSGTLYADLLVQFAGQTARYQHVAFQKTGNGGLARIAGTIPATCADFKIDRPSFLTVPIKNEIPVRVDMTWKEQPMTAH